MTEPTQSARDLAAQAWGIYSALIDEGFTEDQALALVKVALGGSRP